MLDPLKNYLRNRKLKQASSISKSNGVNEAKSIGIIFDGVDLDARDVVVKFAEKLKKQNKKVRILGYIGDFEDNNSMLFKSYNKKSINWLEIPQNDEVSSFIETSFDILFNLYEISPSHVEYIVKASRASLKVGIPHENGLHDLTLEMKNNYNLATFIKELTLLLNKLSGVHVNS
jgi:hypothetical protein